MPRKKRTDDLKRREAVLRDETLHIYRAIARCKRASPSLRLIATDRISAILGLLSPNVIDLGPKQRPPIKDISVKSLEDQEDLDNEVEQILQWRKTRGDTTDVANPSPEV